MKNKDEIAEFLKQNRLFEENDYLYEIFPELTEIQSSIVNSCNIEDFVLFMYALDDNTRNFEITQPFCDGVVSFYYKNKKKFFCHFLKNIKIVYPHALQMTVDILCPILYDDLEARKFLCDSLVDVETENLRIFKQIYLEMVKQDNKFIDECINKQLEII